MAATCDAVRDLADADLGRSDPQGSNGLRVELASYLGRVRGAVATPDTVLVVAGVTQGLVLLARMLVGVALEPDTHWWHDAVQPLPDDLTAE